MPNLAKKTSYAHLVLFSSSYQGASYQMPVWSVVVPHREIQETNTNPMALPWTTRRVMHNKKLLCEGSAALWANASRMLLLLRGIYVALPSCFHGSRQLGQTIVLIHKLLFGTYPIALNTEMSGVRIEDFHCIERCPHLKGVRFTVYKGRNRGIPTVAHTETTPTYLLMILL